MYKYMYNKFTWKMLLSIVSKWCRFYFVKKASFYSTVFSSDVLLNTVFRQIKWKKNRKNNYDIKSVILRKTHVL